MADIDYILEIVAKLRDEASPGIDKLKAKIDSLKATNDVENAEKDLGKAVEDRGRKEDEARRKTEAGRTEKERSSRASEDASKGARDLARDTESLGKKHDDSAQSVGAHTKAQEDFADALAKVKKDSQDAGDGVEDLRLRTSKLNTTWNDFQNDLNKGNFSKGEAARGLKQFSSEFTSLSKKLETGSQDWKDTEDTLDRIGSKLKNTDLASTGGLLRSSIRATSSGAGKNEFGEVVESIDSKIGDLGIRISGVSSELRGFFDLAKIGFSQQLISGVVALAGGLVSVGSAAVQAGAGLAGAFISGLGQAIPMLAIVAASLERFKNILQAVSVAGQAEQQHFYDPTEKQVLQLQQTSQIIGANQQLSNSYIQLSEAQQRVRDSQIALTEARYTAQRQITELANAEKSARLEAEGADISLTESKRQLQISIQQGNTAGLAQAELAVKEAELNKKTTEYAVPKAEREARLARQRGVGGAPAVISAVEGLEGAKVAQLQAQQAGEAAKRQKQITELQQAARSSKETQYESQLKYAEKGMSPTELGLTNALIGIEKELKSPDSPLKKITDYFVEPFTNAVEKIRSLLKTSSFLEPLDELAKSMGAGLGRLEKATYGPQGTTFFEQMAKDATSNVPIISQVIERIMKLFEDIAKAADPAFHKLSKDWDEFWGSLDRKYDGNGLEKLTDFFNKSAEYAEHFAQLGKALFGLFESIGKDAAPQGDKTVTSFTESIKEATGWVQSHGPEVTKFFKEAREGLSLLGGMFFGIGKSLIEVFSLTSLKAFNGFLQELILPGLKDVIGTLGKVVNAVLEFFNLFGGPGRKVLEIIGVDGVIVVGIVKIIKMVGELKEAWVVLTALFEEEGILAALNPIVLALVGIGLTIAAVFGAFSSAQKKNKISTEEVTQALENQANVMRTLKDLSAEYKSSELGVKESRVAEKSAQQGLIRTEREKIVPGEGETAAEAAEAHKLRIEQAKQDVDRSKLQREETEKRFRELPSEQKESAEKSRRETIQNTGLERAAQEQKISRLTSSIKQTREFMAEPTVGGEPRSATQRKSEIEGLAYEEKQLSKAREDLAKVSEKGAQNIKIANSEIARSNKELTGEAPKISSAFIEAFSKFEESVSRGTSAASSGMSKIRESVDNALKKYGVTPAELSGAASSAVRGASNVGKSVSKGLEGFAAGGYIPAKSGGQIARVGEGGHDEVVLSTDPAHAQRSRALLGQYFSQAPHMASGGFVADPGTNFTVNQEPKLVTELRKLGEYLNTTIYGISGYRSPSHSVEVGGFANDPHTRGEAVDIGVGSNSRESASRLTAGLLAKFDLYRPFYPASAAEINHIQLISGDASKIVGSSAFGLPGVSTAGVGSAGNIRSVKAPKIKGGGAIGQVAQGALNLATAAANIFLGKQSPNKPVSPGGSIGSSWSGSWVQVMEQIAKAKHWSLAAWRNVINRESGGDPNALGSATIAGSNAKGLSRAYGLGQFLGSTYTEYSKYGADSSNPVKQIEAMAQYIDNDYGTPTGALQSEESRGWYATGGLIGDSVRRLAVRHLRKKILKFAQGGKAPWGGNPIPIIAHEGERIMNPAQYGETARLAGTSPGGLDRHLGYDSSPRQSFASGGIPRVTDPGGKAQAITGTFTSPVSGEFEIGTLDNIVKIFKAVKEGFKKLKDISKKKYNEELTKYVNEIIVESSGVLARLQEGREIFKSKSERKGVEKGYSKKGGKIQLGAQGEAGLSQSKESTLSEESKYLQEERKLIDKTISETKKLKKSNSRTTALKSLMLKQKELGEAIDSNIESRYQIETQTIQDKLDEVNAAYQTSSQELSNRQSTAQSMGRYSEVGSLSLQTKGSAEGQIGNLQGSLKSAESIGNTELANNIKQEISNLKETVSSSIVEYLSSIQSNISQSFGSTEAKESSQLAISEAFGNSSASEQIDNSIIQTAKEKYQELNNLLGQAESSGNSGLAASIKQEMSSLETTIYTTIANRISTAQTLIERESAQAESKSGERLGLSKVLSSEGKYEASGKEEKAGLLEKQANLASVRTQEEQLREEAIKEGDTTAVITLGEKLNENSVAIAENNLALKENAVVTRELVLNQISQVEGLRTGIAGSLKQVYETLGSTTGYVNVGGELGAVKSERTARESALGEYESHGKEFGLNAEGMSPKSLLQYLSSPEAQSVITRIENTGTSGEKESLNKWLSNLESNSTAILKNTEEIAKLNGQLNQPQSFSTSAQNAFRQSVFNGMGNLLPSYSAALPPGAVPTEMPMYGAQGPGSAQGSPTIGNLNLTHPVERLDPSLLGEEMQYHVENTPSMS